jgi:hypothetical protein
VGRRLGCGRPSSCSASLGLSSASDCIPVSLALIRACAEPGADRTLVMATMRCVGRRASWSLPARESNGYRAPHKAPLPLVGSGRGPLGVRSDIPFEQNLDNSFSRSRRSAVVRWDRVFGCRHTPGMARTSSEPCDLRASNRSRPHGPARSPRQASSVRAMYHKVTRGRRQTRRPL